ncbi:MAG: hypothetical protein A3K60_02830 [Euryarchaeota archaeon RBG_19FT_COMBO_56_21]|nr:MAG: hypothetical protein A3K60_02830 [Euryarchaeota archaeon RBG_19FT_COMBO_56_21]
MSNGVDIRYLLNAYRADSGRVTFHGVRASLIRKQSAALGMTLLQKRVGDHDYEEVFYEALLELRANGVKGMIFGDIDVQRNREWCERIALRAGLEAVFPLWNIDQRKILEEFIGAGFRAVIVAVDSKFLPKEVLGKSIDLDWLKLMDRLRSEAICDPITYCGENGEYHSFVSGGPCFKSNMKFKTGESVQRNGHWLIDLLEQ